MDRHVTTYIAKCITVYSDIILTDLRKQIDDVALSGVWQKTVFFVSSNTM